MEIGVQEVYCEEGRGLSRTRPGEPQAVLQTDKVLANPLWTSEERMFIQSLSANCLPCRRTASSFLEGDRTSSHPRVPLEL